MNNAPVGIFDSGVGGLTAVKELRRLLPNEDIIYFGDTARVPYGTRNPDTIIEYAAQDINLLLKHGVKIIIAACGTVSSTLPQSFTDKLPVPYFSVIESTAKAAVNATKNNRIGVLGTPATIKSKSYAKTVAKLNPDISIFQNSCPLFVPLVENGYISPDNPVTRMVAEEYLAPIKASSADTVIMGCTHYPIIAPIIQSVMGSGTTLINPGLETAAAAAEFLRKNGLAADENKKGEAKYLVSDSTDGFQELAKIFLDDYIDGSVQQIRL